MAFGETGRERGHGDSGDGGGRRDVQEEVHGGGGRCLRGTGREPWRYGAARHGVGAAAARKRSPGQPVRCSGQGGVPDDSGMAAASRPEPVANGRRAISV